LKKPAAEPSHVSVAMFSPPVALAHAAATDASGGVASGLPRIEEVQLERRLQMRLQPNIGLNDCWTVKRHQSNATGHLLQLQAHLPIVTLSRPAATTDAAEPGLRRRIPGSNRRRRMLSARRCWRPMGLRRVPGRSRKPGARGPRRDGITHVACRSDHRALHGMDAVLRIRLSPSPSGFRPISTWARSSSVPRRRADLPFP